VSMRRNNNRRLAAVLLRRRWWVLAAVVVVLCASDLGASICGTVFASFLLLAGRKERS
jgi:dolichol kinase